MVLHLSFLAVCCRLFWHDDALVNMFYAREVLLFDVSYCDLLRCVVMVNLVLVGVLLLVFCIAISFDVL